MPSNPSIERTLGGINDRKRLRRMVGSSCRHALAGVGRVQMAQVRPPTSLVRDSWHGDVGQCSELRRQQNLRSCGSGQHGRPEDRDHPSCGSLLVIRGGVGCVGETTRTSWYSILHSQQSFHASSNRESDGKVESTKTRNSKK